MHIPDGILPTAVGIAGYATTAAATWHSIRKIEQRENPQDGIPKASLLTAAFFVASWIHIPIPPTSVHLVLNGLMGVVLGYYAFPAILIGLFFQAVMFQHGGLTTLGVNATAMGLPALVSHYLFQLRKATGLENRLWTGILAFVGGALGIGLSALIASVVLVSTIPSFVDVEAERAGIYALALAHLPLMALEGAFTASVALFLQRVRPELLES